MSHDFTLPKSLQELPKQSAQFCLRVERQLLYLLDQIKNVSALRSSSSSSFSSDSSLPPSCPSGKKLLIACSGGADSVALLLVFYYLRSRLGVTLHVAHLDHSLRVESAEDASFVQELCHTFNIPISCHKADVKAYATKHRTGIEEAARVERYAFLKKVFDSKQCDWILTAHHQGDLAEDVLMRLTRGTGWPALGGMVAVDQERRLVRPLLMESKQTLISFLESIDTPWCEDSTNAEPCCLRNRLRLDVLPRLREENPAFDVAVSRLWEQARLEEDFWAEQVDGILKAVTHETDGYFLSTADITNVHQALRHRVYIKILQLMGDGQVLADHIYKLDEYFKLKKTGKQIQFPGDKIVLVRREGLFFTWQIRG